MDAAIILGGLMARGIPEPVARGIVTNMQAESGLNPGINEIAPVVPGSRGGYGLNQWTGPRRVQYEAFAAQRGADPADLNTQLDFTVWELHNTEKAAGNALFAAPDAATAARIYETQYLRPGIPHGNRTPYSGPAGMPMAAMPNALQPQNALQPAQPLNALASFRLPMIDAATFQRNRLRA